MKCRYDQPASLTPLLYRDDLADASEQGVEGNRWQQTTLPIGNGDMGATVYGELRNERIVLNEKTLWTGGPGSTSTYSGGNSEDHGQFGATLRQVQSLCEAGRIEEAQNLAASGLLGGLNREDEYGGYQRFGDLWLHFPDLTSADVDDYHRSLDLASGIVNVTYRLRHQRFSRSYFVSHPDDVLVVRLEVDHGTFAVDVDLRSAHNSELNHERVAVELSDGHLSLGGQLHNNGLHYVADMRIEAGHASCKFLDADSQDADPQVPTGRLRITDANAVTIYIHLATDYAANFPVYRTGEKLGDVCRRAEGVTAMAARRGYAAVRSDHLADMSRVLGDTELQLYGQDGADATDVLVSKCAQGVASPEQYRYLYMLLFAYGRYLLVASSRGDSLLPANLQGVWAFGAQDTNGENIWRSDYHLNVNLQMNYWHTASTQLWECMEPLIAFVENLVEPGRITARVYAGTDGSKGSGYMVHTENTPFGWTTPGAVFSWGWSPAVIPWILHQLYDYYLFVGDEDLLRERVYPLLRESCVLYLEKILHPATDAYGTTRLVCAPAYSPEHGPVATDGNTYEQVLIWQLFTDTIEATERLGADDDLLGSAEGCVSSHWVRLWDRDGEFADPQANRSLRGAVELLHPVDVGDSGQIKEWYDEGALGCYRDGSEIEHYQLQHRHLSHLLGLYPGNFITIDRPQYMAAAVQSLNMRGNNATGWGLAQRLNSWARTGYGDNAYECLEAFCAQGIYPNLFDRHPPFQIDGNFGLTAGICELLVQSNATYESAGGKTYPYYIHCLPALPAVWAKHGAVKGLAARGGFTLAMEWEDGEISRLDIIAAQGGTAALRLNSGVIASVTDCCTHLSVEVEHIDHVLNVFSTVPGHRYQCAVTTGV
ncbi:MAG: glycoside hydrolase family 95 protein [Actinomycetaceae bacterium]|nr:glycoside hydrolase family 95 protein [Actinomycetaceae bacterium]MDY5854716.1 glycoside hydrolase family 95 protein [Arcanobacterium sp.]